jgi:predicted ATPase
VLVVQGDAGIGKSALLQYLVDAASGFRVVHATGVESEMELPFAALHQLCGSMLGRLDSLPDPQRDAANTAFGLTAGRSPDRLLIGLAVLSLLSSAAEDGALLCVVDDAQWLDRESTQALTFVARRLLADRVALVFATRESTTDLAHFPELVVDRLHDADAQTLLSAVLHVPLDERVRDRIVAETRGNPLALVEWPRRRPMSTRDRSTSRSDCSRLPKRQPSTTWVEPSWHCCAPAMRR